MTRYKKEEVLKAATTYFKGDALAAEVWMNKYCLQDLEGNLYELTPEDMHKRLAKEFARIENKFQNPVKEKTIFEALKNFNRIVPQGSPMAGIGNNFQLMSISNCFVVGNVYDSYGGILRTDEHLAQLMKRRSGVGTDLSFIRPSGSKVSNAARTSTGIVPYMERYSNTTREVAQGGRRGALMLTIDIDHPDAAAFIDAKLDSSKVTGANISVKITDSFMKKVEEGDKAAHNLWAKIVNNAWKSAEPGILFWDRIAQESIPSCYGDSWKELSTNPCGEIPLCPYDSCRLTAINLYGYVSNPFTLRASFNYPAFKADTELAMRLMDDLVELEIEKIDKIIAKIESDAEPASIKNTEMLLWKAVKGKAVEGRRTGLGVTGLGDALAALGLTYGTDEANSFVDELFEEFKISAYKSSINLAAERGAFPMHSSELEKDNPFLKRLAEKLPEVLTSPRRNVALLTVAPTGSVSLLTQTTSGIECVFKPYYIRRRKLNPDEHTTTPDFIDEVGDKWIEYPVFHHKFKSWLESQGLDPEALPVDTIDELVTHSPYNNATSADVDWLYKVKMQGIIQKHIDHSISVTVNVPEHVKPELIHHIYHIAWKEGCKGVTVYRDGSRSGVLITKKQEKEVTFTDFHAKKRPTTLDADVIHFQNNKEQWVAFVGLLEGRPYELFVGLADDIELPKSIAKGQIIKEKVDGRNVYSFSYKEHTVKGLGKVFNQDYWNYAKLISGLLRHGMPIVSVYETITSLKLDDSFISTWKNGVARVIKRYIPDGEKGKGGCGDCGGTNLEFLEGCLTCKDCGNSKCG